VVCVGTFDGVHRGHQAILAEGKVRADAFGLPLWALCFHPHPKTIVAPDDAPLLLTEPSERQALLGAYGADGVLMMHFDATLARTSAEDFAQSVLIDQLRARAVVVGMDFGFGRGRRGSAAFLREWGKNAGVEIVVVDLVRSNTDDDGKTISSNVIRNALINNDFGLSGELLGHPFPVSGQTEPGAGRGRKYGYPTWNLALSDSKLPPPVGVYAAMTARSTPRPAMVYYGSRPTFGDRKALLEVHVLEGDEQDRTPREAIEAVWLCEYVRAERRFEGGADLARQLADDARAVRRRLSLSDIVRNP